MPAEQVDTRTRTVEVKTRRGIIRVGPQGKIDGLWQVVRREARTNAEVRKMCGGAARETLKRWRNREINAFPEPVMEFAGSGRGGAVEIWSRTQVEAWWKAERAPTFKTSEHLSES